MIEKISLAQERLIHPPVTVHSVNANSSLSPVDDNSLIESSLIETHLVEHALILVLPLDNFDGVGVKIFYSGDGPVCLVGVAEERRMCRLSPGNILQVMLGDEVLVVLKSEHHIRDFNK